MANSVTETPIFSGGELKNLLFCCPKIAEKKMLELNWISSLSKTILSVIFSHFLLAAKIKLVSLLPRSKRFLRDHGKWIKTKSSHVGID